jgi:hypothetical protein
MVIESMKNWRNFIEQHAHVIVVKADSDANAFRMFETLNDRGLKVSELDLVKNYMYDIGADRREEVEATWGSMITLLESLGLEENPIDFLRISCSILYGLTRKHEIYRDISAKINNPSAAVQFVNQLEHFAKDYVAMLNPSHVKRSIGKVERINMPDLTLFLPQLFIKKIAAGVCNRFLFSFFPIHRRAFQFAVGLALLDVVAPVVFHLALAHAERDFYFAILPVKRQRHNRVALDRGEFKQFSDFRFVQEQFARRFGNMILQIAVRVFVNVDVVNPRLVFFHAREGIRNLAFARAQRLDLRAVQHDASLERLKDVIIAPGFVIGHDVGHEYYSIRRLSRFHRLKIIGGASVLASRSVKNKNPP